MPVMQITRPDQDALRHTANRIGLAATSVVFAAVIMISVLAPI